MKKHWVALVSIAALLSACTISFTNIDTHGTADDVVDEEQAATPTISPTFSLPSTL
jgi:hypothetical protein